MKSTLFAFIMLLTSNLHSQLQPGDTAPNFAGIDYAGDQHHLYGYLEQGKYVLLKFGFVTCGPCHASNFHMNNMYYNFGCNEEDLIVLGIEVAFDNAAYQDYWQTWGGPEGPDVYNNPVLSTPKYPTITVSGGSEFIDDDYRPFGYPTFYLIGPDGIVVEGGTGGTYLTWLRIDTGIEQWHQIYQNFEVMGMEPVWPYASMVNYWDDQVMPVLETTTETPFSFLCEGLPEGDGTACDDIVPTDVQIVLDEEDSNDILVSWTGDDLCDDYTVILYSDDVSTLAESEVNTAQTQYEFENLPPNTYYVGVHCGCNQTYESSDPVSIIVPNSQTIITDFTDSQCGEVCTYNLTLLNNENVVGGPDNWLTSGHYVEIVAGGLSGNFWATTDQPTVTWPIQVCVGDPIEFVLHGEGAFGFVGSSGYEFILETGSGQTLAEGALGDFGDLSEIQLGPESFTLLNTTVACSVECDPEPITGIEIINDPETIYTIDWDDEEACASYTVEWLQLWDPAFPTLVQNVVTESEYTVSFFTALTQEELEFSIRCNCEGGGYGPWTETMTIDLELPPCEVLAPTNPTVSEISPTTALVTWEPAGTPCQLYDVQFALEGTEVWSNVIANDNSIVLENLLPNSNYVIQVSCSCNFEFSPVSEQVSFMTESGNDCITNVPQEVTITDINSTTAWVEWELDEDCLTYTLHHREVGAESWDIEFTDNNYFVLEFLESETNYELIVRCVCADNISDFSEGVVFTTSVDSIDELGQSNWMVYPNPVNDVLTIKSLDPDNYASLRLTLVDMVGQVVLLEVENAITQATIDLSKIPSGTYLLEMTDLGNGVKRVEKLMVR